jgi:putative membrane protein
MIVRPRPSFWKLFFVMRGSVVPRILPQIFGFALYGAAVVAVVKALKFDLGNAGVAPFALLGVALSVYMGFRNNAAYDRWWEARKLWGQLAFEIRNLSRAASALISDRSELRPLLMDSLAFCHFLRGELRKVDARREARAFVGDDADTILAASNQPDHYCAAWASGSAH